MRHPRLEEVGRVGSHLVKVEHHVRFPVMEHLHPSLAFRVLQRQPVAVQIEPIVIGSSAGPGLLVLAVVRVTVGNGASIVIGPLGEPFEPVGVQTRIQQDNHVIEQLLMGWPFRRRQVIGHQRRRITAARLVAVHAVPHVDYCRQRADVEIVGVGGIGQLKMPPADRFELLLVLFRGDCQHHQRSAAIASSIFSNRHPPRRLRQSLEITDQFMMMNMPLADPVPQVLLR